MTSRSKAKSDEEAAGSGGDGAEDTPYIAQIVNPPEEDEGEPSGAETPTLQDVPKGHVVLVYRGVADLYEAGPDGEFKFRPGEPVAVPSEVAEDLLTTPKESFEVIEQEQEA